MAQQLGSNYYNSPFKFNGKELDEETGFYYYDARYYDPKISIWLSVDPLAEKFPAWSPYNYCMQNPINAIDPDGRVVIFINGLWGAPTGADGGGTVKHWGNWWIIAAQKAIGDNRSRFYDGSADWNYKKGGTSRMSWNFDYKNRRLAGYNKGKADAAEIVNGLQRDKDGNITESIKFVTSSMGTAFQRGMSDAIVDYVASENKKIDAYNKKLGKNADPADLKKRLNVIIEFTVDLDAFQANAVGIDPNAQDNYYMKAKNSWAGGNIQGSTEIGKDAMDGHHPSWAPAKDLPKGKNNPTGSGYTKQNPTE